MADNPAEVAQNVMLGMSREDAEKVNQFLKLSRGILDRKCRECRVQNSGTDLCRALELTASGADAHLWTAASRAGRTERRALPSLFSEAIKE